MSGSEMGTIVSVKELFKGQKLYIPDYQRPYKWGIKNVTQLINDILLFKCKSAYRLGTIVIHEDTNKKLVNKEQ